MAPSQLNAWAVMSDAAGEARKTIRSAISSGAPRRPSGMRDARSRRKGSDSVARASGVRIVPGLTALTRTPYSAHSSAIWRVNVVNAPLVGA
jgi:hypothetical protein